jgi:hypothetical protein
VLDDLVHVLGRKQSPVPALMPGLARACDPSLAAVVAAAEWRGERAPLDDQHFVACQAMAMVGIVLWEIAEAIDAEWGGEADDAC